MLLEEEEESVNRKTLAEVPGFRPTLEENEGAGKI
jgi:hypothetical protein